MALRRCTKVVNYRDSTPSSDGSASSTDSPSSAKSPSVYSSEGESSGIYAPPSSNSPSFARISATPSIASSGSEDPPTSEDEEVRQSRSKSHSTTSVIKSRRLTKSRTRTLDKDSKYMACTTRMTSRHQEITQLPSSRTIIPPSTVVTCQCPHCPHSFPS